MDRFSLLNGSGLALLPAFAGSDSAFGDLVMSGKFHISQDPSDNPQQSCLCSRGAEECWHCGRQSKP